MYYLQGNAENQIRRLGASAVLGAITSCAADQKLVHRLLSLLQPSTSFIPSTFVKPSSENGIRLVI